MIKRKDIIKIAIDSPAAAGAGTLAKAISKHYNLFYLDTGKIYRMIAYLKIKFPEKFNQKFIKSKIKNLKVKDLTNKALLSDDVGIEASIKKNDQIGELNIYYKDELIDKYDLLASENVKKINVISRLINSINFLIWGDV